jgi:hypothetical protein
MNYNLCGAVNVLHRSTARLRAPAAAASLVLAATVCPADAQVTETVLYAFLRGSDGGIVYAPVIADLSGPSGAPRGSTERPATAVFWRIAAGKVAALCSS